MKTAAVVFLLVLGVFSCFQDAAAQDGKEPQGFCSEYEKPPSACTEEYKPVCGTDGKTYPNKCYFCQAVWKNLGSLCFKQEGKC